MTSFLWFQNGIDQAVSLNKSFIIYRTTPKNMYKSHNIMSLLHDMKLMSRDRIFLSRDKSVDLTGVLSCRTTLFERLRHNLLRIRQVSSM